MCLGRGRANCKGMWDLEDVGCLKKKRTVRLQNISSLRLAQYWFLAGMISFTHTQNMSPGVTQQMPPGESLGSRRVVCSNTL